MNLDYRTVKYLDHLKEYVDLHFDAWLEMYDDVVGISISNKYRGEVKKRYYAIVFHVRRKRMNVIAEQMIPSWFEISIPGRGLVSVPTDVVETGTFTLCRFNSPITPGCSTSNLISHASGSIGPLVKDDDGKYYVVSNMHVFGKQYLSNGNYNVAIPLSLQISSVLLTNEDGDSIEASFAKGILGGSLDIALARVSDEDVKKVKNIIPGEGKLTGILDINTSRFINTPVRVHGSVSGKMSSTISSSCASISFPLNNRVLSLVNLIQLKPPCCRPGDSGCPVFDSGLKLVGLIIGRDARFSYAVNIVRGLKSMHTQMVI